MLTPDQLDALDHAYWHTKRTLTEIRAEFGLTASELRKTIQPLPRGIDCWWCGAPLVWSSRTERSERADQWRGIRCACGARQPKRSGRSDLVASDAAVIAPLFPESDEPWRDMGGRWASDHRPIHRASDLVCHAVAALERCGMAWNGAFHAIEADDTPLGVIARLEQLPTRVLVIPSLTSTMSNEGDSLALFLLLVHRNWRVITAAESMAARHAYAGWCDDLVPMWRSPTDPGRLRLVPDDDW